MSTSDKSTDKRIALRPPQRADLQMMSQEQVERMLRASLPNGQNLSSEQIAAAALTARTTGLNPMLGEFHMTSLGPMRAAKQVAGWANEWMRATGEREPEFSYVTPGQLKREEVIAQVRAWSREIADDADLATAFKALCEAMNYNPATDVAVLVRMYRFSTREQWAREVQAALLLGTKEEVRAIYGLSPKPDHEAWGIVRYQEYTTKKKDGKTIKLPHDEAVEAWRVAGEKFNHLERAKKRGRSACYVATVPVLAQSIVSARDGSRTTHVVKHDAPAQASPDMPIVRPTATDVDDAIEAEARDISDGLNIPDGYDLDDDEHFDSGEDAQDESPAQSLAFDLPEVLRESALQIEAAARQFAQGNRETNEKQDKLINVNLSKLTGKDRDDLKHALLKALVGFEHFGDIPGPYRLALLNHWLKLTPKAGGYPEPCDRAKSDVAALIKVMASAKGQTVIA